MLMLILSGAYAPAAPGCPTDTARRAESQADRLRSWNALYNSFESYRQCDDGAIAEGYSESVARILVDHWNTLADFARLQAGNAGFRAFVLRHIDATLDNDDLYKIRRKASAECPVGLGKLCADVKKQANLAIKEPHQ